MVAVMIEDVNLAKRWNEGGGGCGHYRYPKRYNGGDGDDCSGEAPTSGGGDGGGIPPTGGDGGSDDPPTPGDDGADETPNPGDVGGDETPGPVDGTPDPGDDGGDTPPPTPGDETGGTPPNPGGDGTGEIPPTPGGGDGGEGTPGSTDPVCPPVRRQDVEGGDDCIPGPIGGTGGGEPAEKGLVVGGLEVEVPEVELEAKEQGVEELEVEPEAGERGEEEPEEGRAPRGLPGGAVVYPQEVRKEGLAAAADRHEEGLAAAADRQEEGLAAAADRQEEGKAPHAPRATAYHPHSEYSTDLRRLV
ncbi:hypothetical protein NMY22_g1751 [Coprinellus aureogranulatus]|nr:hypothetical protein NMY22_g1751 [Coprinellus aureogranulatus]